EARNDQADNRNGVMNLSRFWRHLWRALTSQSASAVLPVRFLRRFGSVGKTRGLSMDGSFRGLQAIKVFQALGAKLEPDLNFGKPSGLKALRSHECQVFIDLPHDFACHVDRNRIEPPGG